MTLQLALGIHSYAGRKTLNQDFCAGRIPEEPLLSSKGAAVALADGISSSTVSQIASETAVSSFLEDYYCTSETASVQHAGRQVLQATHAWLYSQSQQIFGHDPDKGYVCTFSSWVVKGRFAYLFHIGDSRAYLWRAGNLQLLSNDHRQSAAGHTGSGQSYLSKALGAGPKLQLDYRKIELQQGDILLLLTDGVYETLTAAMSSLLLANTLARQDMQSLAEQVTAAAYAAGSTDNLSALLLQVQQLPAAEAPPRLDERWQLVAELQTGAVFDGFYVIRPLYQSHRSHVYLVRDTHSQQVAVLKTPATEQMANEAHLARLLLEDWIARRVNSPHLIRAVSSGRERRYIYTLSEYIDGQTLQQWHLDHPKPSVEQVRQIILQVGKGLQALHRAEVLHQDLRPENIMITHDGLVKIIDLGSAAVAGLAEQYGTDSPLGVGTAIYAAPEVLLGNSGTERSDLYALAVLFYYLLSGRFPYGARMARCRSLSQQQALLYQPLTAEALAVPQWLDATLQKAVAADPTKRYQELSAFLYDLQHPNPAYLSKPFRPLLQRDPLRFWQLVSLLLLLLNLSLFYRLLS